MRVLRGDSDESARSARAETVFADVIARYTDLGLLEITDNRLRLTERGLFLGNDVMAEFLP